MEAEKIMAKLHEGTFGTHSSGHTMENKILRAGYYWSTMEADCYQHFWTCHECQIYADKVHVPPVPLNVLTAPWLFAMWGNRYDWRDQAHDIQRTSFYPSRH